MENWVATAAPQAFSWFLEAPAAALACLDVSVAHGDVVRVDWAGKTYLCVVRVSPVLSLSFGLGVAIEGPNGHQDGQGDQSSQNDQNNKKLKITPMIEGKRFSASTASLSLSLSLRLSEDVQKHLVSVLLSLLEGMPYLPAITHSISLLFISFEANVIEGPGSTSISAKRAVEASKRRWYGNAEVKERLKQYLSSSHVNNVLIEGRSGNGALTLVREVCTSLKRSLLVTTSLDILSDAVSLDVGDCGKAEKSTDYAFLRALAYYQRYEDHLLRLSYPFMAKREPNMPSEGVTHDARLRRLETIALKATGYDFWVITGFDMLFVKRTDLATPEQHMLTSHFLSLLDGARGFDLPRVIGIASDSSSVDPALRRPRRMEADLFLNHPTYEEKVECVDAVAPWLNCDVRAEILHRVGGFSVPEIFFLLSQLEREFVTEPGNLGGEKGKKSAGSSSSRERAVEIVEHVGCLLRRKVTSESNVLRSCMLQPSGVDYPMIHSEAAAKIQNLVLFPLQHPRLTQVLSPQGRNRGGILLVGASGTGKTVLVQTLAKMLYPRIHFFELKCSSLFSMFVGQSEANVRRAFQEARSHSPAVLVLDDYDVLTGGKRGERETTSATGVLATLLVEMDGLATSNSGHVTVLALTSAPERIDPALRRPGRIDHTLALPPIHLDRLRDDDQLWSELSRHYRIGSECAGAVREALVRRAEAGADGRDGQITLGALSTVLRLVSAGMGVAEALKNALERREKT
ncbi:AAA-type ATPase [Giardia muris]|uniref:AAA-type ATPase n=1 Tax=Giardia muris TaxID=5742 RepID=A0A4Z1ST89_GIAMU|nr:AAA-type ATPase [Giardia muris]|eukprot:TNJ26868.1 AAA-type ATPase [Giardia muris]